MYERDYVSFGIPFYRSKEIGDLSRGENIHTELYITKNHYNELKEKYGVPQIGDILITSVGSIGNFWICDGREFYYKDGNVTQICANPSFDSKYISFFLSSQLFSAQTKSSVSGTAYNALTIIKLKSIILPLPPLAEQKRIVAKIEELLPKVEEYGKAQDALNKLNEELPERLKKSVLQEAITGRLVPQDPNDEPASVLLDKIRAEKKQLFKEGKLKKKDLEEKPISEDEKPFEIPVSWEWVKLYDCVSILYGYPFESNMFNEEGFGFPLIRIRDVLPARTKTYTTEVADERYVIKKDDMLVGMDGNFNVRFWNSEPAYLNQRVCKIETKEDVLFQKFLYYYFPIALEEIFKSVSYVTVKHLSDKHLRTMYIPLPPLAEQHRIVAKIEEVFKEIDKLK